MLKRPVKENGSPFGGEEVVETQLPPQNLKIY